MVTDLPPTPSAIMNVAKCDSANSNWRTGKCICKKAKLYCRTFFACSLNDDVACEN